jgi:TetR/AcrR family transcriptional repressor of nem operon
MPSLKTNKEKIIKKCIALFSRQGFAGTSMIELAKYCKVQQSHFYHYFSDKDDLVRETLEFSSLLLKKSVLLCAYQENMSVEERLILFWNAFEKEFLPETGYLMVHILTECATDNATFLPIIRRHYAGMAETLVYLFSEFYTPEIASEKAWHAIQDIEGSLLLTKLYGDDKYLHMTLARLKERRF